MARHHQQGQLVEARHAVQAQETAFAGKELLALRQRHDRLRETGHGGRVEILRQAQRGEVLALRIGADLG